MAVYRDMGTCDLRHFNDVEAIKQIEEIRDIGTLILAKDAEPEILSAFAAIPMRDIGEIIYLGKNGRIVSIDGHTTITKEMFSDEEVYLMVNGMTFIISSNPESKIILNVNGMVIINTKLSFGVNFGSINGMVVKVEFDENYKLFSNCITVDKDMLEYIQPNIAIVAGNEIDIAADVTVDILKEKSIKFVAGNTIACHKNILGYIKATSTVGNKIENKDEEKVNQEIFEEECSEEDDE